MNGRKWRLAALAGALGLFAGINACSGKAVIDGTRGSGGSGGSSGTSPSGNGGSVAAVNPVTTGTSQCMTPAPVGALNSCGGTGSVTSGMALQCVHDVCDAMGNKWESDCSDKGCKCRFNGNLVCSCTVTAGQLCTGSVKSCCPSPFPA